MRLGPAKARSTKKSALKVDVASDSGNEFLMPSEFEENDDALANYLRANASFLLNMHSTAAFTVPLLTLMCSFD